MFVIIQGVYSQTPDPAWTAEEMTCGLWTGSILKVKYSIAAYDSTVKFQCGYCFFRDFLSFAYIIVLIYMFFLMLGGWMPKYFNYIETSLNGLFCGCVSNSSEDKSTNCGARFFVLIVFLFPAVLVIIIFPELALLFHVVFDLYVLGGSKFSDCGICNCCITEVKTMCCWPNDTEKKGIAGNDTSNSTQGPSTNQAQPIAVNSTTGQSQYHDPLNLRPRIQFVTKYKPVPIGPPNP